MQKQISSLQNPLIKHALQLQEKSRERRKSGLFVIEGKREIILALKGGYAIETILFCSEIISNDALLTIKNLSTTDVLCIEITIEIYKKLSYRASTEGLLAIAKGRDLSLKNVLLTNSNPLILVAEAPEKPGNIGALLRTADAANLDAVIIANPKTDMYNPNIIRSSVGCVFTRQIATATTSEIIAYLKENKVSIYSAILQESVAYHTIDFKKASAIVVGTESTGLSEDWRKSATKNISIPMQGEIDSMNVSVAGGILIFEAQRQRGFNY